ncbi:tyrosine-type recombinase/integrase [Caulobacter sp. UC70_42]|uniref:tyrosine-type recombinase/integrase n=1 Tax=Caulobacter sp. UC70_42 TaxID=3374551 RepID=UPI0037567C58
MARATNRLTVKAIAALREPGMHADGAGLYLKVDQTLNRRWVLIYFWHGKRREMGLGSAETVTLAAARQAAASARQMVAGGIDPIGARKLQTGSAVTFRDFAELVIVDLTPGWKSPKTDGQWRASLDTHAGAISKRPVSDVDTEDVLLVLKPIWNTIPETASRVRARIERVLDVAKIKGLRKGENPARWRGHLQLLLAKQQRIRGHHAALSYDGVPAFIQRLRGRQAVAARALEFTILAASRTTETREATWSEIDGDVWTIPASRMKATKAHRVPITNRMREILDEMAPLKTDAGFIFPGDQRIEPLSRMAMLMLLRRMEVSFTVHGFRSAFRDWAGDCTPYPRELIEEALAHTVGNAVERAYRRSDALAKRRQLMEAWEQFATMPPNANVLPFVRA